MELLTAACEMQISNKKLLDHLSAEKFDIAIVHTYDFCPLGMVRHLKIPTHIWMSSGVLYDYLAWYSGVPTPGSYVPNALSSMSDRMTYFERVKNFVGHISYASFVFFWLVKPQSELFQKYFGDEFPTMGRLAAKAPLLFVNSNEFIDFPRPILHKVVYIGGIDLKDGKKLNDVCRERFIWYKKGRTTASEPHVFLVLGCSAIGCCRTNVSQESRCPSQQFETDLSQSCSFNFP